MEIERMQIEPRGRRATLLWWIAIKLAVVMAFLSVSVAHSDEVFDSSAAAAPATDLKTEEVDPFYDELFDDEFDEPAPVGYPDPIESVNRGVFAFNQQIDKWILDPMTDAYQFVLPKSVRHAVARVFTNLSSTKTLVNDLLQLEWIDAGITGSRLVLNTTVGLVGIFDVAKEIGLERHDSDFGQTLALAGTPSGPYIVLPVLGPANIRDGVGTVIDGFFQPTYYILGPAHILVGPTEVLLYSGSSGFTARERHYAELKALRDSSIDFYAALRSGYYQDRIVEIWGRRDDHRTTEEPDQPFSAPKDAASWEEFEHEFGGNSGGDSGGNFGGNFGGKEPLRVEH